MWLKLLKLFLRLLKLSLSIDRDIVMGERRLTALVRDFIDRIILATAIALGENLVTEDRELHSVKRIIEKLMV